VEKILSDGTVTTFARSVANDPQGMAYDARGNLYIANDGDGTLTRVAPDNTASVVSTALIYPQGVAVDAAGNVFVANYGGGTISEVSGTTTTTFASGLSNPYGIAFDGSGTLYVAESGANRIAKLDSSGHVTPVADALLENPRAVLVDSEGETYVLNYGFISHISSFDSAGTVIARGFSLATRFAFASGGGFYVLDDDTIKKVDASGNVTTVTTIPYWIAGLAADADGNIYFTDYFNKTLVRSDPTGNKTVVATFPANPLDVILDGKGGLYVSLDNGQIDDVSSSGAVTMLASGVYYPLSIALAPDGTLYTAGGGDTAYAVSPTGKVTPFCVRPERPDRGWSVRERGSGGR
jgi:sugar lactone lactonase YvrE